MVSLTELPAPLAAWSGSLTCYTAAVGDWLSDRVTSWWRPLLNGGPYLGLVPVGDRWRFDHTPRPLAPAAGLALHHGADPDEFVAALRGTVAAQPSVVVAGDVYHLPWQRGHQRWHAPHWFVLRPAGERWRVTDSLAMTTQAGPQPARAVELTTGELTRCAQALPAGDPVFELRERSVLGTDRTGLGATYRWLSGAAPDAADRPPVASAAQSGAAACDALAELLARHGHRPSTYEVADDLWQAVRQRELLVAAGEVDPELLPPVGRAHWFGALGRWRALPPLLLHARLRAQDGVADPAAGAVELLRELARYEGRHLVPEADA